MQLNKSAQPTSPGRAEIPLGVDESSSGGVKHYCDAGKTLKKGKNQNTETLKTISNGIQRSN